MRTQNFIIILDGDESTDKYMWKSCTYKGKASVKEGLIGK